MPNTNPSVFPLEQKGHHIFGFDSIRFLAASMVVFCHIEITKYYRGLPMLVSEATIYETGRLAIAAFFALSGFLITLLLLREKDKSGTIHIFSFYMRRGLRIWPLYYLITLLIFFVLPHSHVFYLPSFSEDLQQHFIVKLVCSLLLMPQMILLKFQSIPGGEQLWTIGVEEIFYLLWPIALLKSGREFRLTVWLIALILIAKIFLYTFSGYSVWPQYPDLLYKAYLIFYYNRVDCLLLGSAAAILVHRKNLTWLNLVSNTRYAYTVVLIVFVLFLCGLKLVHIDYFYYSLCFAGLVSFLAVNENHVAFGPIRITEKPGEITYGIYVWHYIVVLVAFALLNYFFAETNRNSFLANAFLYITTYLLTYTVAALSYRFIETPFLRLKKKFQP